LELFFQRKGGKFSQNIPLKKIPQNDTKNHQQKKSMLPILDVIDATSKK
jgi:hypothetical protein